MMSKMFDLSGPGWLLVVLCICVTVYQVVDVIWGSCS